jgi:hypothetical protein
MKTSNTTPSERLALSRERLRVAMSRPAAHPVNQFAGANRATGVSIFDLLRLALPGARVVIDALAQWWAGHTPHSAQQLASQVADDVLRPLAKRHPIALVAGAAALGALLIWSRPWRWVQRPQVVSTLGPVVLSSILASGVLQAWLHDLLAKAAPAAEPSAPPPPASAQAGQAD